MTWAFVRGTKERDLAELFIRKATIPERVAGFCANTDAGWERQLANMADYWLVVDHYTELDDRYLREILQQEPGGQ